MKVADMEFMKISILIFFGGRFLYKVFQFKFMAMS